MSAWLTGLMLLLIRREWRVLERRMTGIFDPQISLNIDKCLEIEQILLNP